MQQWKSTRPVTRLALALFFCLPASLPALTVPQFDKLSPTEQAEFISMMIE